MRLEKIEAYLGGKECQQGYLNLSSVLFVSLDIHQLMVLHRFPSVHWHEVNSYMMVCHHVFL